MNESYDKMKLDKKQGGLGSKHGASGTGPWRVCRAMTRGAYRRARTRGLHGAMTREIQGLRAQADVREQSERGSGMKYVMGIDIGGTTAAFGLFDEEGTLIDKSSLPTAKGPGPEITMDWFASHVNEVLAQHQLTDQDLLGLGLGIPGPVVEEGWCPVVVNLGWGAVNLPKILSKYFSCPIKAANDANLAALGESWKGAGAAYENMVMLTLGTGVGAGIIAKNRIFEGSHGAAGEIGHMPFLSDPVDRACECGRHDCLELVISATGIVARAREAIRRDGLSSQLSRLEEDQLTAERIFACAKKGDGMAQRLVDTTAYELARALTIINAVLDPDCFVIGGGVSQAGDQLLEPTRGYFQDFAFADTGDCPILQAQLGADAGIYGAARLILQEND